MASVEDSFVVPQKNRTVMKCLENYFAEAWRHQTELRILVTGKTGQGKSALINGILGDKLAKEGARAARCTTEVNRYAKTIEGVPIKVFDSPGLQDGTDNEEEYIKGMREQCQELSLVLYCTKMTNTRLSNEDRNAMLKLTKAFGEGFWDYAVVVLTFANQEDLERHDDRDKDDTDDEPDFDDEEAWGKLKKERFEGRLVTWKEDLQNFLKTEVSVSPNIVNAIPVVPTGDSKKTPSNKEPLCLPDRNNWFVEYWNTCCKRVKDTRLFIQVHSKRLCNNDEEEEESEKEDDDDEFKELSFESALKKYQENIDESFARELQIKERKASKPENDVTKNGDSKITSKDAAVLKTIANQPKTHEVQSLQEKERDLLKSCGDHLEVLKISKGAATEKNFSNKSPSLTESVLKDHPTSSITPFQNQIPKKSSSLKQSQIGSSPIVTASSKKILSSTTSSVSDRKKSQGNLLFDQNISIDSALLSDITAETMRRAGFGDTVVKIAVAIVRKIKRPTRWLMKVLHVSLTPIDDSDPPQLSLAAQSN